jgi:peptide/nickel transport system substrate-binding protein
MEKKVSLLLLLLIVFLVFPSYTAFSVNPSDTVVIVTDTEIERLDARHIYMREEVIVGQQMFEALVVRNKDMTIGPALAESYHAVDPLTWEFKLRRGIKFHNGEPFNAYAAKYTFDYILNPTNKAPSRGRISIIKEVKIIDDYTVRIITENPWPIIAERLQIIWMVPPKYIQEKGNQYFNEHPVGTGPFKFVEWIKDQKVVMKANKEYWKGPPKFENLIFRIIPESSTRLAELQSGAVDIIRNVTPDQVPLVNKWEHTRISSVPILRVVFFYFPDILYGFSKKDSPTHDKRVRLAINLAIDRNSIVNNLLLGMVTPIATIVNPMQFGYEPALKPYPYDPERAKKLLTEAGYPKGFTIDMYQMTSRVIKSREIVAAMISMFEKVGIKINLHYFDQEAPLLALQRGKKVSGITGTNWGSYGVFDVDGLSDMLLSKQPYATVNDPDIDKWVMEARETLDKEKRKELYSKVQHRLYDEAYHIPLHAQREIHGVNKRLIHEARGDEFLFAYDIAIKN